MSFTVWNCQVELVIAGLVIPTCQTEFHHEVGLFAGPQFENVFVKPDETVFSVES